MSEPDYSFADRITYTIPRAARLLQLPSRQVRSWLIPHRKVIKGIEHVIPPLWDPTIEPYQGQFLVTFLELMELKIVRAMLERRKSKRSEIRACIRGWRDITKGMPYFLVNKKFAPMLMGSTLAVELKDDGICVGASTQQLIMKDIVMPELVDLEYHDGEDLPSQWVPKEWGGGIIVSPAYATGKPVVKERHIPTEALAVTAAADGVASAAQQWRVSPEAVQRAVDFERSLDQRKREAA